MYSVAEISALDTYELVLYVRTCMYQVIFELLVQTSHQKRTQVL